jgi:hypothetical protein
MTARHEELEDRIERLEEALRRIVQWSEAYPLEVFPEPDMERAHEVLRAAGMTLDAISASAMRHVITQVGEIAQAALSSPSRP